MAISLNAAGTWAESTADAAVTIPGTPVAGNRIYVFSAWKDFATTAQISGWTEVTEFANGTTTSGANVGSVKVAAWYRDWQSGDGNPTVDYSVAPTIAGRVCLVFAKAANETWDTPTFVTAGWPVQSTGTVSASSTVNVPDGCAVLNLMGIRNDNATFTRGTSGVDVASGITWNGNYVESPATHLTTVTGHDMAADSGYRLVTTGAAGATLRATATLTSSDSGSILWVVQGVTAAAVTSLNPPVRRPNYGALVQL